MAIVLQISNEIKKQPTPYTKGENNKKKINEMIKTAEGRATARTIRYQDNGGAIDALEEFLEIPKLLMVGVTADIDVNAKDLHSAYKYRPVSTPTSSSPTRSPGGIL